MAEAHVPERRALRTTPLLRRLPGSFGNGEGTITIEFTLMLPVFIVLLILTVNVASLFLTENDMYNVARDTVRRMSTRELKTAAAAQSYAQSRLYMQSNVYTITPTVGPDMTITITTPIAGAAVYAIPPFNSGNLTATARMRREP